MSGDVPAGFTPEVLASFEREPELIDVVALHLLHLHFAPGLHEEILEAVGLERGTPVATRRRDMAFRAAVLEAYLAQCCVCGFSLRLVDGLIGVDAAHIRWHAHGGPDEMPNGLALCDLHHRLFDHGAFTVREDMRVRVARSLAGRSARDLFKDLDGQELRLPVDEQFYPRREHLRRHHAHNPVSTGRPGRGFKLLLGCRQNTQREGPGHGGGTEKSLATCSTQTALMPFCAAGRDFPTASLGQ